MTNTWPRMTQHHDRVQVRVRSCRPDANDLAWTTLGWLGNHHPRVGDERATITLFKMCMRNQPPRVTLFANPLASVTAVRPSPEFLAEARRQQRRWIKQLNTWLFGSARVKRHYAMVDPIIRQLEFTGVMIVNGKHIRPDQWPEIGNSPINDSLVGRKFGKLAVTEELPGQQCRCRCQCGQVTVKKRKHLVAGRTKSCGCLRDAKTRTDCERKGKRAWIHSGELRLRSQ